MFELFFLLILNYAAAMEYYNEGSQSSTNNAGVSGVQTEAPLATTLGYRNFYLLSKSDLDILNASQIHQSPLNIDANQPVFCQKVSSVMDSVDRTSDCVYTAQRDTEDCSDDVKPSVQKLTKKGYNSNEMLDVSCGPETKEGVMFAFGYKACDIKPRSDIPIPQPFRTQENLDFFEVYKFCYSKTDKAVIYTEHEILYPELLTGLYLKKQQYQDYKFKMMSDGFEFFGTQYERMKKSFKNYELQKKWKMNRSHLAEDKPFIEKIEFFIFSVDTQQFVPVDDMAFALTRKPTYHYLNIGLMERGQLVLWNFMSHLIREDARLDDRTFTIKTGAFKMNPGEKNETEEPIEKADIWIKMIYKKQADLSKGNGQTESLAIVMNTGLDEASFKEFNDELCKSNLCENAFATYEYFSETRHLVRCCPTQEIAKKFFNTEVGMNKSFKIEAFTKVVRMTLDEQMRYIDANLNLFPTYVFVNYT